MTVLVIITLTTMNTLSIHPELSVNITRLFEALSTILKQNKSTIYRIYLNFNYPDVTEKSILDDDTLILQVITLFSEVFGTSLELNGYQPVMHDKRLSLNLADLTISDYTNRISYFLYLIGKNIRHAPAVQTCYLNLKNRLLLPCQAQTTHHEIQQLMIIALHQALSGMDIIISQQGLCFRIS